MGIAVDTILVGGRHVLAKVDRWGKTSKKYANRTAAQNAAEKVGGAVWQPRLGPVFYVAMDGVIEK